MKVSVIIPCYNSSNTIRKCIESVFNQTFLPYEIIVVDDGSSDNTLQLLEDLSEVKPLNLGYRIIKQVNSGPSVARNKGIRHAKGNWIAFLDSDDYWLKQNLFLAKEFLTLNNQYSILAGGSKVASGESISFNSLLFKNSFITSTVIVKKECVSKYPFNEYQKFSEDYRSWLLITHDYLAYKIYGIEAFPVRPRIHSFSGGGLSSKLWKMEMGELSNFRFLRKERKISSIKFLIISVFSLIKYFMRLIKKVF